MNKRSLMWRAPFHNGFGGGLVNFDQKSWHWCLLLKDRHYALGHFGLGHFFLGHFGLGHFDLGHFDLIRMPHLALSSVPIARVAETLELQALVWSMVSPYRAAIT
jgi:hypothetical protein